MCFQNFYALFFFFWTSDIKEGSCERGMKVYHHILTLNSFQYDFLTQNNKDVDFFSMYCKQTVTKKKKNNVKDNKSGQFSNIHCVQCP